MDNIIGQIIAYINIPYLLIFMLSAYFFKQYFEMGLELLTKRRWKMVYSVLILGILIAIPFLLLQAEGCMKIICSYFAGTSLYELLFKQIENRLKI